MRSLGGWEVLTLPFGPWAFTSAQMSIEDDSAGSGLHWPSAQRPLVPVSAGVGSSVLGKLPCLLSALGSFSCWQCSPRRQLEPGPSTPLLGTSPSWQREGLCVTVNPASQARVGAAEEGARSVAPGRPRWAAEGQRAPHPWRQVELQTPSPG